MCDAGISCVYGFMYPKPTTSHTIWACSHPNREFFIEFPLRVPHFPVASITLLIHLLTVYLYTSDCDADLCEDPYREDHHSGRGAV